jgi:hypothetical protein
MKRRNAILLFGIVAIVAAIALVATADEPEDRGTRAGETYVGSDACKTCHNNENWDYKYDCWEDTYHGMDFTNWDYHGSPVNKYTYGGGNETTGMTGSCASCHTVGYGQTDIGGFDPAYPWNDTTNSNNANLLSIGCEDCHGPGSEHASSMDAADINVVDPYTSCQGTENAECHYGRRQWGNETLDGWNTSAHAPHDNDPETDHGMNTYCASCKSPSQWDPEATRQTGVDIPKAEYRGITCGDCHELHPDPDDTHEFQLKWEVEESCDACHNGGHHETMRTAELGGEPSLNRTAFPYMEEVSCVECHMWSSPRGLRGTEYEHVGHTFEPAMGACLDCHTSIFDDIPDTDDTVNWTAWETDYLEVLEEWEGVIEAAQDRHDELLEEVNHLVEEVEEIMEVAEENGTWTEEMEHAWEQAEYDWELADHQARGAHNPAYATALLNSAKESLEEILLELSVGTLTGKVTDGSDAGIADVYIYVDGDGGTKTDSNGMYTIVLPPGTYDISAFKDGTVMQTASDIVVDEAAVETQNFTLAPDADGDGTSDATDTDDDNDGVADTDDAFPNDPCEWIDSDNDTIGDNEDTDDDGDGVADIEDAAPWDATIDTKVADIGKGDGDGDDADTTMYLVLIIILIVVVVLLLLMLMKKGGSKQTAPPPEPETPIEEE